MMPALSRRSALLLALAACAADLRAAALPGDSIYQLRPQLVDQDGKAFELASTRGQTVLASMFYSSCQMVCPVLFETIAQTIKALPAAQRDRVRVVMISFDPERDTVEVLKETAQRHGCGPNWTLARGSAADVRRVAAVLGVQYRRLDSGEFNHSTQVALLDADGRIVQRSGKLGEVDPALVQALRHALEAKGAG